MKSSSLHTSALAGADVVVSAEARASRALTAALARAGRLLSHAIALTPVEWQDVVQRAHTLDAVAHRRALQRMSHLLVGHPQSRALDALNRGACAAANGAMSSAVLDHRSAEACTYAGRVAAHAVLALALGPDLPPGDVELLTSPFRDASPVAAAGVRVERAD